MRADDKDTSYQVAALSAARLQFLGHEFLTWLYFYAQSNSEIAFKEILGESHGDELARLVVGNKITLKPLGAGDNLRVAVAGSRLDDSGEVLQAIRSGTFIDAMAMQIGLNDRVHELTLMADGSLSQVKTRYLFEESDSESLEGNEGGAQKAKSLDEEEKLFLRMAALDEIEVIVDGLFKQFLTRRLSQAFIAQEIGQIRINVAEGLKAKLPRVAGRNEIAQQASA